MPAHPTPNDTLLAGATGLVGREIVRHWPMPAGGPGSGPGSRTLHVLARRPLAAAGIAPPAGARVVEHAVDFAALPALPPARQALCALGTTIRVAGSQAAFRAVDLDAVVAFARAAKAAGVERFGLVSALGAHPASSNFYNRTKGDAEAAVEALGFARLVIARPSLIVGDRASLGQPGRTAEGLAMRIATPLAPLIPAAWRPIPAARIARALLKALADDAAAAPLRRLTSAEMQRLGA